MESTEDVRLTYAVRDQRQSTLLELSEVGEVLTHETYFPYGGTAWLAGPSALDVRLKERRFAGRDRDVQTGLYDFGQRYYAAWLCRWISADPAGPIDGPNLYAYVRGDPIGRVDADGQQSADPNAPKVRYHATPEFPAGAAKTLPEGHVQWPDENGMWHSAPLAEVVERERQKGATEVVVTTPARPDPAEVAEFESMLDSLSEYTGANRLEDGDSSGATTRTSHTTPDATEVDTREPPPTPILTLLAGESPEAFAARVVRQSQDPKYVPPDPDSGLLKLTGYSVAMGAVLGLSALASLGAAAALGATAETWTGVAVIGAVGNATADVGQRALDDAALRGKVSEADKYVEGAVDSAFLGAILALPARWIGLRMTPNDKNVAAAAADQTSPPTDLVDDAASSATHVPAVDPSPPLDARASAAVATAGEEGAAQLKPYLRAADAAREQSRLRHPGLAEDAVASGGSGHTPMSPEEVLDIAQSLKQTEGAAGGGALTGGAGAGSAEGAALPKTADRATREIALGRDVPGGGYKALAEHTGASRWQNWARDGITRRTLKRFGRAFSHATRRADKIHFSLDGIDDPVEWAQLGRAGFENNQLYSAAELFIIKNDPALLAKTIFYRGVEKVPSPF